MADPKNEALHAALQYNTRGWNVVPLYTNKRPMTKWDEWKTKRQSVEDVTALFINRPHANVGVITGAVSGIIAIDADSTEAALRLESDYPELRKTLINHTSRGRHYLVAHPGGIVRNSVGSRRDVDVRGDGGYIVVPPSTHESGVCYEWNETGRALPSPMSASLAAYVSDNLSGGTSDPARKKLRVLEEVHEGVAEGKRNDTLARLAGHYFRAGHTSAEVLENCLADNAGFFHPPLSVADVENTVASIARRETAKRDTPKRVASIQRMSEVQDEEIDWLYEGNIALGCERFESLCRHFFRHFSRFLLVS